MKHLLPIAIVFIIILIAGCGSVTSAGIDKAKELCEQNGDVLYIHPDIIGYTIVCNNGARFSTDAISK